MGTGSSRNTATVETFYLHTYEGYYDLNFELAATLIPIATMPTESTIN